MIDVLLLGNGAMMPLPQRWLSSVLLRVEGSLILLDCGEGTQIPWRQFKWGFKRLDAICLSHVHADHVAGLPGLFHTVANAGRTSPMHIYGPRGIAVVIAGLRVIAPYLPYEVIPHELDAGAEFTLPAGMRGQVAAGDHRVPVLAYRFDMLRKPGFQVKRAEALGIPQRFWGTLQQGESVSVAGVTIEPEDVMGPSRRGISLGFVTDTRPVPTIRDLVRGVDLLISEGTYGDDADAGKAVAHGHMTFREAATLARDAAAGTLWLTHFGAGMTDPGAWADNARSIFPNTTLGYTGLQCGITFRGGYEPSPDGIDPGDGESPESDVSMKAEIASRSPT
jgi:ribonuclease Z